MKNLLGLMVVGAVLFFAFTMEDEQGVSTFDRMFGGEGTQSSIQLAEEVTADYADATQRRIDAEFGN